MRSIGVIGAGKWGKNLIATLYSMGELAAVVEVEQGLRQGLSITYPETPVYATVDALLQMNIIAVVIATPADTHYSIAVEALLAGKDVFIEKPFTLSSIDGEELVKLANMLDRILMVGHLLLYQPAIVKMKQMIQEGVLGDVQSIHQERLKLGRVRTVENVLWSFGVHDIAVMLYLLGDVPEKISCSGQSILQPGIEDDVHLRLMFAHNVHAHLHVSWLWPDTRRRLTVIGSRAMAVYDEIEQQVTLHKKMIDLALHTVDSGSEMLWMGTADPLRIELKHFLDAIEQRTRPQSDGESSLEVVRILESANMQLVDSHGSAMGVKE